MRWAVDFTTRARADLVGLEADESEAVTDTLVAWLTDGPPLENRRELAGFEFYESTVAGRYLLGYAIRAEERSFAVLWLRPRPTGRS